MKKTIFYLVLLLLMGCKHSIETPTLLPEVQPLYPCTIVSKETFGCTMVPSVSCQNPTSDSAILRCLIVGTWNWVWEGETFRNNVIKTPQSTGNRVKMTFRKDGISEHFRNDTLILKSPYSIWQVTSIKRYILQFKTDECTDKSPRLGSFYRVCGDSLFLDYSIGSDIVGDQKWVKIK